MGEEALAVRVEAIPRRLVQTTNQCWVGRCRATPKEQASYSKNKHAKGYLFWECPAPRTFIS